MSEFSRYYKDQVIDHLFRGVPFEPPRTVYCGLFIQPPSYDEPDGVEVARTGNYGRVPIKLTPAAGGHSENAEAVVFPRATAAWGTIRAGGIFDAARGGNLLAVTDIGTPRLVEPLFTVDLLPGILVIDIQ